MVSFQGPVKVGDRRVDEFFRTLGDEFVGAIFKFWVIFGGLTDSLPGAGSNVLRNCVQPGIWGSAAIGARAALGED